AEAFKIPLDLCISQAAKVISAVAADEEGAKHHVLIFGQGAVWFQRDDLALVVESEAGFILRPRTDGIDQAADYLLFGFQGIVDLGFAGVSARLHKDNA